MRLFLKTIPAMILATIFLVSLTGIRLLIHHCMACDTKEVSLVANFDGCCEHHQENYSHQGTITCSFPLTGESSCCVEFGQCGMDEDCCRDEVIYLVNDYELTHERQSIRIESLMVALNIETSFCSLICFSDNNDFIPQNYAEPPPRIVGKEFVLFTRQIKIG